MTDDGFNYILTGIRESVSLKYLDCTGNIIGEKSLLELSNILGKFAAHELFLELSLNKVKILTNHLNSILEVMGNNCSLHKLGLSRLAFDEISIDWLVKILMRAKSLYSLDISGCEILAIHLSKVLTVIMKNRRLEYLNISWLPIGTQGEMIVSQLKDNIIKCLTKFMTRNKQLIHVDLSYSRITDIEFEQIVDVMLKSPSLISIHLTGNGITNTCKEKSLERLKGVKLNIEKLDTESEEIDEKLKTKMVVDQKYILWKIRATSELVFNNTWVESNQCYICQKWRYSVFMFSIELAAKNFAEFYNLPTSKSLLLSLAQIFTNAVQSVPEKENHPYLLYEPYRYMPIKLLELKSFYSKLAPEAKGTKTFRTIFDHIETHAKLKPYFCLTPDHVRTLPMTCKFYLAAVLIPPGKVDYYFVRNEESQHIYYSTTTIPAYEDEIRATPLPPSKKKVRIFSKPNSVFKNWQEDTPGLLAFIFKKDFEQSKLSKMIKNQLELDAVYDVLLKSFAALKEEFISVIVKSSYPKIGWNDFTTYCQQKGVTNKDIILSVLDRLFIAVNTKIDHKDDYANRDRELCRSNFIEIMVRIAEAKYKETGQAQFLHEAVERLAKDITTTGQSPSIHKFRKENIWTLPIDDLLRSNREGIRKVYQRYSCIKRYISLSDVIQLIQIDCGYDVYQHEIVKAYGYSKMTVRNEQEGFSIFINSFR